MLGEPLPWNIYDENGRLFMARGYIVENLEQLDKMYFRGLYLSAEDSEQLQEEEEASQRNRHQTDNEHEEPQSISPFDVILSFYNRLSNIFLKVRDNKCPEFSQLIFFLAADIQHFVEQYQDAALGVLHIDYSGLYTLRHPIATAILAEIIARRQHLEIADRLSIICAALTANISKTDLQEKLSRQSEPLTSAQLKQVQLHPILTIEMLKELGVDNEFWSDSIMHHHEKLDGSGYPHGAIGNEIPYAARIIAMSDIYSAMLAPRSYRKGMLAPAALREIFVNRGKRVDEETAQVLISELGIYPPGCFVVLQNGETAIVTRRMSSSANTPEVLALIDQYGGFYREPITRDTAEAKYKVVKTVVRPLHLKLDLSKIW